MSNSDVVQTEAVDELRPLRMVPPIDDDDDDEDEADFDHDDDDETVAPTPWGRWIARAGFASAHWWLT